jgi:hypothetical protein
MLLIIIAIKLLINIAMLSILSTMLSMLCLPTLLQEEKLIANSMDPDQTARMRRLVWIHAGRKPTMLVLSWRGSYDTMMSVSVKIYEYVIYFILSRVLDKDAGFGATPQVRVRSLLVSLCRISHSYRPYTSTML